MDDVRRYCPLSSPFMYCVYTWLMMDARRHRKLMYSPYGDRSRAVAFRVIVQEAGADKVFQPLHELSPSRGVVIVVAGAVDKEALFFFFFFFFIRDVFES